MNTNNLPLSFLGEYYLGILGGLMVERPLCFDPASGNDLLREFQALKDIEQTQMLLDQILALDMILGKIDPDTTTFTQGVLTYKTLILTLWAKNRLSLPPDLEPIDAQTFKPFFSQFFSASDPESEKIRKNDLGLWICEATGLDELEVPEPFLDVIESLINELEEEYSGVNENDLDPRFMPHFLLTDNRDR